MKNIYLKLKEAITYRLLANRKIQEERIIPFLNKKIKINNINSFLQLNYEIFKSGIYKFNADSKSPVIFDCGAYIGLSTIYFKTIFPDAVIHAFEPDINNFTLLKFNIESFDLKNIHLYNNAVWTEDGMVNFSSDSNVSSRITSFEILNKPMVKSVSLKRILKGQAVDLLKIDIEGTENILIEDIGPELKNIKNIFIEYHSEINSIQNLHNILKTLSDSGFRYHIHDIYADKYKLNKHPFIDRNKNGNFDMQLNLFAYRL
jgi:FkbM family methyltransferase